MFDAPIVNSQIETAHNEKQYVAINSTVNLETQVRPSLKRGHFGVSFWEMFAIGMEMFATSRGFIHSKMSYY